MTNAASIIYIIYISLVFCDLSHSWQPRKLNLRSPQQLTSPDSPARFKCIPRKCSHSEHPECFDRSWFRRFRSSTTLALCLLVSQPMMMMMKPTTAAATTTSSPMTTTTTTIAASVTEEQGSIVFDNMDEVPVIEESVMYGSKTTIIKQREVRDENCMIKSRFGDLMEIHYVAKKLFPPVRVYDASIFRGTGQPFKFVLGGGALVTGVDQGLYDMCPGEVRLLKIPPKLAVGLLDPPAKAPLEWRVELVAIEGMIRQDNNNELTRDDYDFR